VPSRGHSAPDPLLIGAVSLANLRSSIDTRAARLLKDILDEHRRQGEADTMRIVSGLAAQLTGRLGIDASEREARLRAARTAARRDLDAAARHGLAALPWFDARYPPLLSQIPDPPVVLWFKGDVTHASRPAVAVVGSRRATPAGLAVAGSLSRDLAAAGLVIVSGLARGVDAAAHEGALSAGGQTVAVLGCGLDRIYPPEHEELASRIAASGAVISELPPGVPPLPHQFPLRNRIISGLSRAVVVIEAGDKSGSLITARAALEQGRDVLAVPGSVASGRYRGSHALLKDGARLVETVEDVLSELGWKPSADGVGAGASDKASQVSALEAEMATGEPYALEDLGSRTGRSAPDLLADLTALELAGRVVRIAGGAFVRLDESAIGGERPAPCTGRPKAAHYAGQASET